MPESLIVYTCVTGGYDRVLMPAVPEHGLRFICFTDSHVRARGWELRPPTSPARLTHPHDINRFHKVFPHRLFPQHRWSIYIDGNIQVQGNWKALVEPVRRNSSPLGAFRHPDGRNLVEEVEACVRCGKFDERDRHVVAQQVELYRGQGLDLAATISANYLLVRDHFFPGLDAAMSLWWSQLFEFSKRDQISLQYALWRHGLDWISLDGTDGAALTRLPHHKPFARRVRVRAQSMARTLLRSARPELAP